MKNSISPQKLFLFTTHYPFGTGVEVFVENEVKVLADCFHEIYIYAAIKRPAFCNVPPNVHANFLHDKDIFRNKFFVFICNIIMVFKILNYELAGSGVRVFLKYFRSNLSYILKAIQISDYLSHTISDKDRAESIFYSFWMNHWALVCAVMKYKKKVNNFIFRVHGYDLYDYLRSDGYIPFLKFNLMMCDGVYTVSNAGQKYLKSKNIFPEKISVSHLGVFDNGINPFNPDQVFTLVSCSNLNKNKRVDKIIEVLKRVNFQLQWIHFGGTGDWLSIDQFKNLCDMIPKNIQYEFHGVVKNEEIINFYKNKSINLFIHLSYSEGGVPVVLQEAVSFGIPVLAADAGGVSEIVNERTGILIDNNFDINDVTKEISRFRQSYRNTEKFRAGVKEFWKENFSAQKNYSSFFDMITKDF